MKIAKKVLSTMLALAVAVTCITIPATPVQAAPRTTSYVYDAKTGINYQDKIRCPIGEHGTTSYLYSAGSGDYIAKAKADSKDLIVKVTQKTNYLGNSYGYISVPNKEGYEIIRSHYAISYFSTKPGKYTVTLTINNAKKKKIATKKVTVYVNNISFPFKSIKFAGKDIGGTQTFSKTSGALKIKMNKTYKLKKIEVGKYDKASYSEYSPEPTYIPVKNGASITLAQKTAFKSGVRDDSYYDSSYYDHNYICPVTFVRITYVDTLLNTQYTNTYRIYLKK